MIKLIKVILNGTIPVLGDWNFRFFLVLVVQVSTILLIVVLHLLHEKRARKNHARIRQLVNDVKKTKKDIYEINKQILPYLEDLSTQRDNYKSKLKTKRVKVDTAS